MEKGGFGTVIRRVLVLSVFLAAMFLGASCTQQRPTNRVFSFFFPPGKTKAETQKPVEEPEVKNAGKKKAAAEKRHYVLYSHKPFIERKCGECHKGASGFITSVFGNNWDGRFRKGGGKPGPLILPPQQLCGKCHKELTPEWAREKGLYLHKTAAEGECLKCHDAHQSRYPDVLKENPEQLCISCHNKDNKIGAPTCMKHNKPAKPCLSCHNAHLGKSEALLKKDYEEKQTVFEKKHATGSLTPQRQNGGHR